MAIIIRIKKIIKKNIFLISHVVQPTRRNMHKNKVNKSLKISDLTF